MVEKRQLSEELYEVPSKLQRHLEPSDKKIPFLEFTDGNVAPKLNILGEDGATCTKSRSDIVERLGDGNLVEFLNCNEKEIETSLPGSSSSSSWGKSITNQEDLRSETPCISLSPNCYNLELPEGTIFLTEDNYSSLLEHPPQKLVPIGRDFQAEIPEWCEHGCEEGSSSSGATFEVFNLSSHLKSGISNYLDFENKLSGSCIVPVPGPLMSEDNVEKVGGGRIDCSCDDVGSIRCVQQHINEARNKLSETLGHETFVKLGFLDMGEVMAEKWTEEEEEIFHEVVFSNPASLGRNFWNHLAIEFPSRTKKEIVSFYFNVFMLRRRAEQNRVDVLDIDSDNDEWEGTNISADEVIDDINRYDDSVVGSPAHENGFCHDKIYEDNICEYDKDITGETSAGNTQLNLDSSKCISKLSSMDPILVPENCSSDHAYQPLDKVLSGGQEGNHEVHYCSYTSEGSRIVSDVVMEKTNNIRHSMSCSSGRDFLLEPCGTKEWDVGHLTCSKNEDFLPTCSVIEQVFGAGAWNHQTKNG